jgi:hypothetical protein
MGLQNYLEKLRRKPIREKERIAIIATAVAFLIFFGIWLLSLLESGKQITPAQSSSTINEQLGGLKDSIGQGKQSIQDLIQNPSQGAGSNNLGTGDQSDGSANSGPNQDLNTSQDGQNLPSQNTSENNSVLPSNDKQNNNQNSQSSPQEKVPSGENIPPLP